MADRGRESGPVAHAVSVLVPMVVLAATLLTATLAAATPASAHDTADGAIAVVLNERRVAATSPVPFAELGLVDTSGDGLIDAAELATQQTELAPTLVDTVRDRVALVIDGEPTEIIAAGVPSLSGVAVGSGSGVDGQASTLVTLLLASGPHDGDVTDVEIEWAFDSPSTEVVLTHPGGVTVGQLGDDDTVSFSLDAWSSAAAFFGLGVEHIRFGPDHLLFLLVLTLAVAGTSITTTTAWRTVKLVTAFTVGHALSLGLAYFNLISMPAELVEPAISLSIVAAAVLVILGRAGDARPWIAAVIGVVHGLGFASSLANIGVATTERALALAAFNLGIDIAQTAVVLIVLGMLWVSARAFTDRLQLITTPTAAVAGLIGLAWTATRLTSIGL